MKLPAASALALLLPAISAHFVEEKEVSPELRERQQVAESLHGFYQVGAFPVRQPVIQKCIVAEAQGNAYERVFFERNGMVVFDNIGNKQPYCI